MDDPKKLPDWAVAGLEAIRLRGERARAELPPEVMAAELQGMRVIVIRNERTGEIAPARVVRGSEFADYDAYCAAVSEAVREIREAVQGTDWTVEDAWARSIEDFTKNYPELVPNIWS